MVPAKGEIIDGKYEVEHVLGQGGMGVVLAATHLGLGERVALKLMHEMFADERAKARFVNEARAAAKLKSEHVARVLDVGESPSGQRYLVMEFLKGADLSQVSKSRPQLSIVEVVDWMIQVCLALDEAHSLGIVHRDVKPANLFLAERPDGSVCIKVLDFGISKNPDAEITSTTVDSMGSPLYMAPEQMASARTVDGRADVWSCGAVLFKLLTGEPPFGSGAITEVVHNVVTNRRKRVRELRPEVPVELERIVDGCLQQDLSSRLPSAAELSQALAPFASPYGAQLASRLVAGGAHAMSARSWTASEPAKVPPEEDTRAAVSLGVPPRSKPSRAVLYGAGLLLVAAGAVAAWRWAIPSAAPSANASAPKALETAPPPLQVTTTASAVVTFASPDPATSVIASSSTAPIPKQGGRPSRVPPGRRPTTPSAGSISEAYDHR